MNGYLNDGGGGRPRLRCYLNTDNLVDLPAHSLWPGLTGEAALARLATDGFDGVQIGGAPDSPIAPGGSLPFTGTGRINHPAEAGPLLRRHADRGDQCITLHVGWGIENDAEAHRLVEAVLAASQKTRLPAFIETHRATITQDMWRTVKLIEAFPEIRFNADLSHYYCGQEMVYGDFAAKLDFLQPLFDRVGYMHGRIASPGFMQAPIETPAARPLHCVGDADYLGDFMRMWRRAMNGFRKNAPPGSILIFSPELLGPRHYYAAVRPAKDGRMVETSDRYAEALLYLKLARHCFEEM